MSLTDPAQTRPAEGAVKSSQSDRPWWRHRWPWLLMLGPALAVVGCVITIVLAIQAYGDQDIRDGGNRQGLVVTPPPTSR